MSSPEGVTVGRRRGNRTETCRLQTVPVLDGPLSGYTVGVTADRRRHEQAELLARRGAEVLLGPVLAMVPLCDDSQLRAATSRLIADPPDVVVLSTGLGVRTWCSAADALGQLDQLRTALVGTTVVARGNKAAGAAVAEGIGVDWTSPNGVSEEVVSFLAERIGAVGTPGRRPRLALQLDGERSVALVGALSGLGYEVEPVPVYGCTGPQDIEAAERLVAAAADRQLDAVTFTSVPAVAGFTAIAGRLGVLDRVSRATATGALSVACVGPVTAAHARESGLFPSIGSSRPRLGAMVHGLVEELSGRSYGLDLSVGRLSVQGQMVTVGSEGPIRLPGRERALLGMLARNPGAVVSKQALLDEVWSGESDDHVVEVTVARLRRRLGIGGPGIETVVRRGYRLATR